MSWDWKAENGHLLVQNWKTAVVSEAEQIGAEYLNNKPHP